MLPIIYQIILCLIAASILGFIIGWVFSSFVRNEQSENHILAVQDKIDKHKEKINQIKSDLYAKDKEVSIIKEEYETVQKEMLSIDLNKSNNNFEITKIADLEYDNTVLTKQIKEQKICEDANEDLENQIKEQREINKNLFEKIEELKEFEQSYRKNIDKIAQLESVQYNDKELMQLEIKELTEEKQYLLEKIDKLKDEKNNETEEKIELEKKINELQNNKKQIFHSLSEIDKHVCEEKKIIDKSDISQLGLKEVLISKVIKDLFK